jgi:hypothetical protein
MKATPDKLLKQTQAEIARSRKLRQQTTELLSRVGKTIEADKRTLQKAKKLRRSAS